MTKETAKDYLPLVQALAVGMTIQINADGGAWLNADADITFTLPANCYRIKPPPREFYANIYGDGNCFAHKTLAGAKAGVTHEGAGVLFREVL